MGISDCYCVICGVTIEPEFKKDTPAKYDWLRKIYIITKDEIVKTKKNVKPSEYDFEGLYKYGKKIYCVREDRYEKKSQVQGKAVHKDCYKLLKSNMMELTNRVIKKLEKKGKITDDFVKMKKNILSEYQVQLFEFEKVRKSELKWTLKSPLKNKKNEKRILKIWKKVLEK